MVCTDFSNMHKLRALVADDDPELLELVSAAVERFGAEVVRAVSGHELLTKFAEDSPFDFVITDVSMPWMTGLQVMHSARAAGSHVPVIVITAMRDQKIFEQARALGDRAILLLKPFSQEDLRVALRQCAAEIVPIGTREREPAVTRSPEHTDEDV